MQRLRLDGAPVTLAQLCTLASGGPVTVEVAPMVRARLEAARDVVARYAAGPEPVYGLNTGLGAKLGHRLGADEIGPFQAQILAGRRVGVGEPLPVQASRAAVLARLIGAAQGASGLSPAVVDMMAAMAARDLWPVLPSRGSIGAGDLALAAEMGATLLGQGELWQGTNRRPADRALAEAGLAPAALGPKDGLALANHSAVTTALAALALDGSRRAMDLAMGVAALSGEGYGMNPAIFDPRLHALRPAAGQQAAAAWFRAAFQGSALTRPGAARSIQDALSFRVMAPLFGAARTALAAAMAEVEVELNGAADNPAVLAEAGEMLSTPNFHTPSIALALDALAIAQAQLAAACAQRVVKLMAPQLSGLPRYLSPVDGASAGFMPMQKTVAALLAEIRLGAQPASLDAMPVSEMVEDVAPQTPLCAAKLAAQTQASRWLTAIEAVVAAQAVDLRRPASLGRVAQALHPAIRAAVPPLGPDRATGPDIAAALAALDTPRIAEALAL